MTLSTRLRYEKTLRANKSSTTFNAPGNYPVPYGRGLIKVGGRGPSGNATTGGTVANYNAPVPGNLANYNPTTPGNVSGYNPPTVSNWSAYMYIKQTGPGNDGPYTVQETTNNWNGSGDHPPGYTYYASTPNNNTGVDDTYYIQVSYADAGYVPGNASYNPSVPGNANYNPSTPGTANYNPTVPGNPAPPMVVAGVTFPGGSANQLAPVVAPAPSTMSYSAGGYAVTVPPGAYVTITPI